MKRGKNGKETNKKPCHLKIKILQNYLNLQETKYIVKIREQFKKEVLNLPTDSNGYITIQGKKNSYLST